MPPKTLTAEQVAEIDRQQQPQRPVNWQSVIPQKEDVLTYRVGREAVLKDKPTVLTADEVDAAEAQNSVAAETSFGRATGAQPDRAAGPQAPGPKKVLSSQEVERIDHERVSDIAYFPTIDEWRRDEQYRAGRDNKVGKFIEAGKAIGGGIVQMAAATAYAPFDFVVRGTKAYDEWVNSAAEGVRQAGIGTAELWSWAGDVYEDNQKELQRLRVLNDQVRQRLAAENRFTGNLQQDEALLEEAIKQAKAQGLYDKTPEDLSEDEAARYQRFIRDRSFQQQAANITETNIGTLPDGRAEMGIDESKLNPGLVLGSSFVFDPLNVPIPLGLGAVNKVRLLRRVGSLTGKPLKLGSRVAGGAAQKAEDLYSGIIERVESATGVGEAGQAAAVSSVSWKAAAAMATLKGSGRVLRNVERGLETGSILAREIGIGGVGVSRVEEAGKLRGATIPERYRRAYDGFFTSADSTLRRISETPGLSPIARRSSATLDKLGATQVFRAADDAVSGAVATAPIALPLAAIAPEERQPEILGAIATLGAGAGLVGGKVRRVTEFEDALVAKMLADAEISGGDATAMANMFTHDKLVNMARMQSVISAKADFIPLRATDYELNRTVQESMGLGTRGMYVDAQKGHRPRIFLNLDKMATGDIAGHEIGHAILKSNILGGEIKQGMRAMADQQYGTDGVAARGREYVTAMLTQEVRDGTTGIQLNALKPDEVTRIAAAGGDEAAEQALKQEFIRERWANDAEWRKSAIVERTDLLNQERLAQGENAWDWARDEIAAETFSGLGKGLNLSGIRASGPLGRAVGAASAAFEAMGARMKGNGRLETPNQLFVENPLFNTPEMRKAVNNYVKTFDRYLVGLEKEGKIKQRGTPIAPTGKASDAARSPHTRTYANTKNGVTVIESDLFIERPDGTRVPKSQQMIDTQERARAATLKSINDRTRFAESENDWGARKVGNRVEVGGPTLPLQFDNFIQVPQWLRAKAREFEAGRAEGRSYLYSYNAIGTGSAGSYKVKNLGNVEAKTGEMVPFGWAVSQKNHLLAKVIDLNSFRAAAIRAIDNEQLGEFGNDLRAVEAGLKQMLRNYQDGNPGETGLGVTRKNILNGLLGTGTVTQRQNNSAWYTLNNQGSVRSFRFDRLNYADPYGTGYFPHYNKININALPDDAGRMSMDSYRQFDADRKAAWMNREAVKRGYSNATNWQNADSQGFQAADGQYRQEFPTESMPQQIPREAQGMPDVGYGERADIPLNERARRAAFVGADGRVVTTGKRTHFETNEDLGPDFLAIGAGSIGEDGFFRFGSETMDDAMGETPRESMAAAARHNQAVYDSGRRPSKLLEDPPGLERMAARGQAMPDAPRRYVSMEKFIEEAGDDLNEVLANAYNDMEINEDRNALVGFSDTRNSMYRGKIPVREFFDWLHSDEPMKGMIFDKEYKPATPGEGASHTRESYQALINRLRDTSLRKPKPSAAPRGQAMPDAVGAFDENAGAYLIAAGDDQTLPVYQQADRRGKPAVDGAGKAKFVPMDYDLLHGPGITRYSGPGPEDTTKPNYKGFAYDITQKGQREIDAAIDSGAVDNAANRVVAFTVEAMKNPEIAAGKGWYSRMRDKLLAAMGERGRELFAQLLGATSAKTPVEANFLQAFDAYEGIQAGRYDRHRKAYLDMLEAEEGNNLTAVIVERGHIAKVRQMADSLSKEARKLKGKKKAEVLFRAGKLRDLAKKPASQWTRKDRFDITILAEDILPLRSNGKKFNSNSHAVLKVIAGTWLDNRKSPKTPNFAGNLTGRTLQATIDVWAARHLRELLYAGSGEPWRIQPRSEVGVNPQDFALGQIIFQRAAKKLDMNPDDLQAILWFAEKNKWDVNGWTGVEGANKSSFDQTFDKAFPSGRRPLTFQEVSQILSEEG